MRQVLLPVLLLAVFGVAHLEGSGRAQLGARGSAHFGSPRTVGFGAGVRSYRPGFGYRPRGLRFGLRYPRSSYRSRLDFKRTAEAKINYTDSLSHFSFSPDLF